MLAISYVWHTNGRETPVRAVQDYDNHHINRDNKHQAVHLPQILNHLPYCQPRE